MGRITRAARLLPLPSNPGVGAGWYLPVASPPSVPGDSGVTVLSPHGESWLAKYGPDALPDGRIMRKYEPLVPLEQAPGVMRKVPTRGAAAASAGDPSAKHEGQDQQRRVGG